MRGFVKLRKLMQDTEVFLEEPVGIGEGKEPPDVGGNQAIVETLEHLFLNLLTRCFRKVFGQKSSLLIIAAVNRQKQVRYRHLPLSDQSSVYSFQQLHVLGGDVPRKDVRRLWRQVYRRDSAHSVSKEAIILGFVASDRKSENTELIDEPPEERLVADKHFLEYGICDVTEAAPALLEEVDGLDPEEQFHHLLNPAQKMHEPSRQLLEETVFWVEPRKLSEEYPAHVASDGFLHLGASVSIDEAVEAVVPVLEADFPGEPMVELIQHRLDRVEQSGGELFVECFLS